MTAGIVLTGGASRRMGTDKAFVLPLETGETITLIAFAVGGLAITLIGLTYSELAAAMRAFGHGAHAPPGRAELEAMIERFPDGGPSVLSACGEKVARRAG